MRLAFCSICHREVHLADNDPLTCPVCSSPLIETAHEPDGFPPPPTQVLDGGPELYLG